MNNNNIIKIAVVGPAHSGKSVFLGGLMKNLGNKAYLFRACPDGEGTWTYMNNMAPKLRQKGKFTDEIVNWYIRCIRESNLAPIMLIDLGGKISLENKRILTEAEIQYCIIIARSIELFKEWEDFMTKECKIKIMQKVWSNYDGVQDEIRDDYIVIHHLERGEDVSNRPGIIHIANKIIEYSNDNNNIAMDCKSNNESESVLNIEEIALMIGKDPVEKTLPNGKTIKSFIWTGEDIKKISRCMHNKAKDFNNVVKLNGAMPSFLAAAIVHELHMKTVYINSPDGYVQIKYNKPYDKGYGENVIFNIKRINNLNWLWLEVSQEDPSIPLDPKNLENIVPPEIDFGAKVIISGRMPLWLSSSIAMAYHGVAGAVAMFQPGSPTSNKGIVTVVWSHTATTQVGEQFEIEF